MSDNTDDRSSETSAAPRRLTATERARLARKEQYTKAKERKKAYLATPEAQKRVADQKAKLNQLRKDRSDQIRARKKDETINAKKNLSNDQKSAREAQQRARDLELKQLVRPALTLLQGGGEG